jgi:putative membrane protein
MKKMTWLPICSRFRSVLLASILLGCCSGSALQAQEGNPAGMQRSTANAVDRVFAEVATRGGLAEVALARIALERSKSEVVEDFAKKMVDDHGKANEKLAAIAKEAEIALPKELDPEHKKIAENLASLSGRAFDERYLTVQLADHQKTTQLLSHEIGAGQNKKLIAFATETLPVVLRHLGLCRQALEKIAGEK